MRTTTITITLLLFCFSLAGFCQLNIEGRVIDAADKKPLIFANVFISNTTKGQQTDDKGRFKLINVPSGTIDLVISYVGYQTFSLQLKADTLRKPLLIMLNADAIELQGVTIKRLKDGFRKYYHIFEEGFMGKTNFSKECKLKNSEALTFSMNNDDSELIIRAEEPLKIENKALGYVVKYQLEEFRYNFKERYISFWGYPFFEEMKTRSDRRRKQWIENRNKAYYGSSQHFLKALTEQKLSEEGYVMHTLIRQNKMLFSVPLVAEKRDSTGNIVTEASKEKMMVDSADLKLRINQSLKKLATNGFARYIQYLVRTPLKESEIVSSHKDVFNIEFTNHLYVIYNKEFEEPQFADGGQKNIPQTSILSLLESPAIVEKNGHLINPLAIVFEGRWGYEKMGELLPLDYLPDLP
ncbi:carboxypeptidase-like regulatory domain-containing protein [Emticicia sp. BO119]|uniref:carboxypeptidase-like regulatory domain-containing protein n=1 Tax=Emticicia sp. BO119 TaxID=2757768 RepID=UPI0015F032FB|nr:carboxypeptidase-like regulatory domain-containing protein [Emticicia sp. BO119]MBA4850925.1 carboxypeptidase-like regulatory domain-containing protein [Emticicia sp. BO119]